MPKPDPYTTVLPGEAVERQPGGATSAPSADRPTKETTVDRNRSAHEFVVNMPMVEVKFTSHVTTGTADQTRPGMGIRAEVNYDPDDAFHQHFFKHDGWTEIPLGVIPRDHLRRLIDFMETFLAECEGHAG